MNINIGRMSDGSPYRRKRRILFGPLLLAAAIILFQFFGSETFQSPETGEKVRVALSPAQENALGLQSFEQIVSQSDTIDSGPELEMVRTVVKKLINGVDDGSRNFEWAVTLIRSDQVNAFCLPGGKIAVYTGILPVANGEGGLATVLGHEIAHATLRHGAQRMFTQQIAQTALGGVQGSLGDFDPQTQKQIMGVFGAGVQYGIILPYGREHETEADEIGLRYLVRAGYDPEEAVKFWQRMEKVSKGNPPEWLSTHPSHGTRIERLRKLIAEGVK